MFLLSLSFWEGPFSFLSPSEPVIFTALGVGVGDGGGEGHPRVPPAGFRERKESETGCPLSQQKCQRQPLPLQALGSSKNPKARATPKTREVRISGGALLPPPLGHGQSVKSPQVDRELRPQVNRGIPGTKPSRGCHLQARAGTAVRW